MIQQKNSDEIPVIGMNQQICRTFKNALLILSNTAINRSFVKKRNTVPECIISLGNIKNHIYAYIY